MSRPAITASLDGQGPADCHLWCVARMQWAAPIQKGLGGNTGQRMHRTSSVSGLGQWVLPTLIFDGGGPDRPGTHQDDRPPAGDIMVGAHPFLPVRGMCCRQVGGHNLPAAAAAWLQRAFWLRCRSLISNCPGLFPGRRFCWSGIHPSMTAFGTASRRVTKELRL